MGIVNQGTIDQAGTGGALSIQPTTATAVPNAFTNSGTIDAEATNGSLTIDSPTFTNSGAINVANGETATIGPAVTGTGTNTISGGSTLEFEAGVSTAATLGDQDIAFAGASMLRDLLEPSNFYGEISGFAASDAVELLGSWSFSGISQAGDVTTLARSQTWLDHARLRSPGDYARRNFSINSGTTTTIRSA